MSDRDAVPPEVLPSANVTQESSPSFADQSYLTYLVPSETDLDLETVFKTAEPGKSLLDAIGQRESLFFDETADVLLVLKAPWLGEKDFQAQLRRLLISLEVRIAGDEKPAPGRHSAAEGEIIFTGSVEDVTDPFILVDEEQGDQAKEARQSVYAVWKLPVFLARPRSRVHSPSVIFSASASLKPEVSAELNTRGSGYLQSGFPSGLNLLESFTSDPALGGVKPRLSALRVSRVAPVTRQQDLMKYIRALQQLKFKIHPVVHTRVRFSRPATTPPSTTVMALLEVDFTPHFEYEVLLDKVELSSEDSIVENLNDAAGMKLPLSCVSHDHITLLYHIKPHERDIAPKNASGILDISVSASVQISPQSCTPRLTMSWTAAIDFSTPVNPSFGTAGESGIQRSHKPAQLSINSIQAISPLKSPSLIRPDALPALEASTTHAETVIPDLGITMSFNVPTEPVRPGDIFSWTVYVVNRSTEKSSRPARKLALVAVPRRRRNEVRHVRPPSTASKRRGEKEIADAVLDENVLHAMQKNSVVDSPDVVCLSADTRVGPLAPGACHVVGLQFLALRAGVLGIEAIRVIDLGSQEHVDIRDLPTMIVEPAAA